MLARSALRGLIYNTTLGVYLKFHLNPTKLNLAKTANYSTESIPLYHTPEIIFQDASQKKITFDLFFDSREMSSIGVFNNTRSLFGITGIEAIFESFIYPNQYKATSELDIEGVIGLKGFGAITDEVSKLFETTSNYYPPPDLYFVFGPRWYRSKLEGYSFEESNFNKMLVPQQLSVSVSITVLEEGEFFLRDQESRRALALAETSLSLLDSPYDLVKGGIAGGIDLVDSFLGLSL